MIEIVGLILLCNVNKKNAVAVGKRAGGAIGLTIGLWLGAEFLMAVIGGLAELGVVTYILALVAAAAGGVASYFIAKKPPKQSGVAQQYASQQAHAPVYGQKTGNYGQVSQAAQAPKGGFCINCDVQLAGGMKFCPACGATQSAVKEPPKTEIAPNKNCFYVFAVQGPAFGMADGGDIITEKAQKLKDEYEPAKDMELKIIRPNMWSAKLQNNSTGGMISVSYNFDQFRGEIRKYLSNKENVKEDIIENGIRISGEQSLQLTNPMSGLYVMGIPIVYESAPVAAGPAPGAVPDAMAAPEADSAPCTHTYMHFKCTKCGEKAPKPQLAAQGTRTQGQYTYEDYTAGTAEEAKYFLEQTSVTQPLYYVLVHTPQGDWGKDKDGMFLSQLCGFQRDVSLRQCDAKMAMFPERMLDLQMAATKAADNYLLSITCGVCAYEWLDGVAYRAKTIVKCPECGRYNLADTEHIRFNDL